MSPSEIDDLRRRLRHSLIVRQTSVAALEKNSSIDRAGLLAFLDAKDDLTEEARMRLLWWLQEEARVEQKVAERAASKKWYYHATLQERWDLLTRELRKVYGVIWKMSIHRCTAAEARVQMAWMEERLMQEFKARHAEAVSLFPNSFQPRANAYWQWKKELLRLYRENKVLGLPEERLPWAGVDRALKHEKAHRRGTAKKAQAV
jgi:hypothetical protein